MPTTIHCIRHGQGYHNLEGNYNLPDPELTPLGESQCLALQQNLWSPSSRSKISLITASPMRRTLHTGYLVFEPLFTGQEKFKGTNGQNPIILALPDAQETSDDACDIGSEIPVLQTWCNENHWPVDLSLLTPTWNKKTMRGRYSPHSDAIKARARDARIFLRRKAAELAQKGEKDVEIALVTHGGFLHYFTDDWEGAATRPGTGWVNCEMRSYTFEDENVDGADASAMVVETMESRQRRGAKGDMMGRELQKKLFEEAMVGWEGQGLQRPDRLELGDYVGHHTAQEIEDEVVVEDGEWLSAQQGIKRTMSHEDGVAMGRRMSREARVVG